MSSKIKGMDQLDRNVRKLIDAASPPQLAAAAKAGGLVIQNAAKQKAPVLSGTLRRSIHLEVVEQRDGLAVVEVGTDIEYAARVEFGFDDVDSLGRDYNQPAQPYLRPAVDDHGDEARREVVAALRDMVTGAL